jgi:hypothetical protein
MASLAGGVVAELVALQLWGLLPAIGMATLIWVAIFLQMKTETDAAPY